jgi:Protein of unknown function (DUF2842)
MEVLENGLGAERVIDFEAQGVYAHSVAGKVIASEAKQSRRNLTMWIASELALLAMTAPHRGRDDGLGKMKKRLRKFIGSVAMLLFVTLYALVAMVLTQTKPVQTAPWYVQTLVYAVFGLIWILPVMPLIKWMERPDAPRAPSS